MNLSGRSISKGTATAPLLKTDAPISFLGGVNPETGVVIEITHPLYGQSVAGKVLAFPHGKGSTVGSYVIYALARNKVAPAAIINIECETIIAIGVIIAEIPAVDKLEGNLPETGTVVTVDGTAGTVTFS